MFATHPDLLSLDASLVGTTQSEADCISPHTLYWASQLGPEPYLYSSNVGPGTWSRGIAGVFTCTGTPTIKISRASAPLYTNVRFGVAYAGKDELNIKAVFKVTPI